MVKMKFLLNDWLSIFFTLFFHYRGRSNLAIFQYRIKE